MTLIHCAAVLMCFVGESFQQFSAYTATGVIDVYSPFTAGEPIFTSNANRFGYHMDQSQMAIHSQLEETYRLVALYWFLQRMPAHNGRAYGAVPITAIRREFSAANLHTNFETFLFFICSFSRFFSIKHRHRQIPKEKLQNQRLQK